MNPSQIRKRTLAAMIGGFAIVASLLIGGAGSAQAAHDTRDDRQSSRGLSWE